MQRAEKSSRLVPESPETRAGLRPGAAFLLLSLVVAVVGAVIYLTRPEPAPTPTGTKSATEPNFALTNEEAIARFEELHGLELDAYRTADPSLVAQVFTPNSPIVGSVEKEVRTLIRDQVTADPLYLPQRTTVIVNSPEEIRLEQVVILESHFYDRTGAEITSDSARQKQTIVWTIRQVDSRWLLHDAVITKTRRIN